MEHIVRSLNKTSDLTGYIAEGYADAPDDADERESVSSSDAGRHDHILRHSASNRSYSRASTRDGSIKLDTENVTPEMESRFFTFLAGGKAGNRLSIADVADRHLRDKTDAIADIVRNISDQCAAAVEGLQLAHDADAEEAADPTVVTKSHQHQISEDATSMHTDVSQLASPDDIGEDDGGHGGSTGHLTPNGDRPGDGRDSRTSSIPPTPDLVEGRSNTSMSGYSNSTGAAPDRGSQQWHVDDKEVVTKIVSPDDTPGDDGSEAGREEAVDKRATARPVTARIVA